MATNTNIRKNIDPEAQTKYSNFVKEHRNALEYLLQWGSPVEKAKASIMFDLANNETGGVK